MVDETEILVLYSIVVPAYNYCAGLPKLIEAFLATAYKNFELIIVDDGSKDGTQAYFGGFSHPQVRYLRKDNAERGAARNYGADRARGRYVGFFDQDDIPWPTFFAEADSCRKTFGEPDVFCLACDVRTPSGEVTRVVSDLPDTVNDALMKGNDFGAGGIFVKREIVQKVRYEEDREVIGSEDWLFLLRLAARFPIRFWNKVSWTYLDTGNNSVYRFTEPELNSRKEFMLRRLRDDPDFMAKYGQHLPDIAAMRDVYTALHLALLGGKLRPLFYLGSAFATRPLGIFRRATLGTFKNVLMNILGLHRAAAGRPGTSS